ncbi:palmitoyltransferase ZDHHC4 isoform X2 [Hemitrygon akajei]|uniref:palmitoyltransferase ZDHHC4 isoform X2 n=1 Tax=Hemitrygon akajei TaxID=2704970 RepID=UPI003BF9FE39
MLPTALLSQRDGFPHSLPHLLSLFPFLHVSCHQVFKAKSGVLFSRVIADSFATILPVKIQSESEDSSKFGKLKDRGKLMSAVKQMIGPMVPQRMQVAVQYALHRFIHQRNSFFLALHLLLEVAVYGEYSWEVFPYALELGFTLSNLLLPYILLFGKMYFFYLCCVSDPGKISPSNHKQLLKVYTCDGILYQHARVCSTCKLVKLARSRHCRLCNCCVHRFDHHCVWVNNCIGALNIRYFLFYLVTLSGMAAAVAIMTLRFLVQVALMSNLPQAMYVNAEGEGVPVGILFIVQKLFLIYPRIFFMLGFTLLIAFLLAGYTAFHLFLVMTNQTSNEWYKYKSICRHHMDRQTWNNLYHRGFITNLKEIICPVTTQKRFK